MRIGWICLIICFACSCRYIGPVDGIFIRNLTSRPDSSILIGTWEVDNMSYDLIKEQYKLGNRHVLIQILKSGDFHARNIPDFVLDGFGKSPKGKMHDANGKWEVIHSVDRWKLALTFNPGELYINRSCIAYNLYLQNGKLILWDFIGDPDEGCRLLYKRIKYKANNRSITNDL